MRFRIIVMLTIIVFVVAPILGKSADTIRQDTVDLTIAMAEQRFVTKNLTLLINRFNIDIARDNMLQARLWFNPNLNYGTTLYNVETHKFFADFYPTAGFSDENFQIQQLVTLAGRHKATWNLAEVGIKQAQYQLLDILRNLKYELHTDLSDLYYNRQLLGIYKQEEQAIEHMIAVTKQLYNQGNAAGNEVIQLQAQLQDVVAQELSSQQSIIADEQDLKILLCYPASTVFRVADLPQVQLDAAHLPSLQVVTDTAVRDRPDLLLAYAGDEYARKNLNLQYATSLPDLTVGVQYSGVNASAPAYTGIYGTMDLPVFNRNQWNIRAAKDVIDQSLVADTLALITVKNQVWSAYSNLIMYRQQLEQIDKIYGNSYERDLDEMMKNAVLNYERRAINLLSLLSILGTYIDAKTNLLSLRVQYFNSVKNLNLNAGIELIK